MPMDQQADDGKNRPLGEHEYSVKCENPLPSEEGTPDHNGYWGDSSSHPPSYDSIFGQFQDTTDGGGNSLEYFKSAVVMFLGTAGCTVSLMLVLAIPMSMILIGAKYKDDCPIEPFIPIYLIVAGSFGMIKTIIVIMQGLLYTGEVFPGRSNEKPSDERPFAWVFLDGCLNLFLFTWFVAGNVWVYAHYKPHFAPPPHQPYNYCNQTLYLFSFWVITISYMIVGLLCLCTCCLGLCASCTAYLVTSNNNANAT